jgi:hypothetical protein
MEAQRLITVGSWVLAYTDTASIDSANVPHFYQIPATDCERKESVSFAFGINYHAQLVCNQPAAGELIGSWNYLGIDSVFGYGLKTDSPFLNPAKLLLVSKDSLKLVQRSSFTNPDNLYAGFVEKTYSR